MRNKFLIVMVTMLSVTAWAGVRVYNGASNLGVVPDIKCSTGLTCTKSGRQAVITVAQPDFSLENGEVMSNSTDDTVSFASEDEHTTVQITGFEAKNAILNLYADQGDDSADKFSIKSDTSNVLSIINNATTLLSFSSTGVQTLADSETLTNASDQISFAFDDAAARVNILAFEATAASLYLQADESDDNGDDWKISSEAANTLTFSNDTSGSQVAKLTIDTSGNISAVGSLLGDGGDALSGFLQRNVASTTVAITAAQCGDTFVSNSADVMVLPEASTVLGCRLTFICGTADDFDIDPADGTDQFLPINSVAGGTGAAITPSAGDAIRCTDAGASIVIQAVGNDAWAAVGVGNLAWTDVN